MNGQGSSWVRVSRRPAVCPRQSLAAIGLRQRHIGKSDDRHRAPRGDWPDAEIMRARLQADAQLLVRFNDKRGGSATSASLAAALRSAGKAMDPNKDILAVFLTSHGGPDGLDLVAGRRRETLSPRSLRAMLNASGARYRVIIISACYSGVFARALADRRTLVITAAAPDRPSFGCEDGATWTYFGDAFFNQA